MSNWALLQMTCNLVFFAGLAAMWLRLKRPPQDDPRLSRGLQLLQTKITVLEDLSDRTEAQVKQLTALIDQKSRALQNKMLEAEQQMSKIDHSMTKSLEVAEIFQDKIPHQEIVERQQKVEYVRAARLAHSGLGVDEIVRQVALPREQVELIAKFNRERLMFDEDRLPEWASRGVERDEGAGQFKLADVDFISNLDVIPNLDNVAKVDRDFKASVAEAKRQDELLKQTLMESKVAETIRASGAVLSMKATAQTLKEKLVATAEDLLRAQQLQQQQQAPTPSITLEPTIAAVAEPAPTRSPLLTAEAETAMASTPTVRKVVFPRIDTN